MFRQDPSPTVIHQRPFVLSHDLGLGDLRRLGLIKDNPDLIAGKLSLAFNVAFFVNKPELWFSDQLALRLVL